MTKRKNFVVLEYFAPALHMMMAAYHCLFTNFLCRALEKSTMCALKSSNTHLKQGPSLVFASSNWAEFLEGFFMYVEDVGLQIDVPSTYKTWLPRVGRVVNLAPTEE